MDLASAVEKKSSHYLSHLQTKEELKNKIRMELYFWGSYEKIPPSIKKEIDYTIRAIHNFTFEQCHSDKSHTEPGFKET